MACGSLVLACVIAAVLVRHIAPAEKAAPAAMRVVENEKKPGARDVAPPSERQNSAPDTVVRQPEAQTSASNLAVPLPEAQKSKPNMAAPRPEAERPKPETATVARQPEVQTSAPTIAAPLPEAQKPKPDVAASLPEAPKSKPETAAVAGQPEAQTSAPSPAVPLPEARTSKPDVAAPLPEAPKSKPATVARQPEAQTSGSNTAVPLPEAQTSAPNVAALLPEQQKSKPETDTVVRKPEAQASRREAKNSTVDLTVPQLVLSADVAKKIGQKIWLNETGGKGDAITSWNPNEEFASLGIGHFIWFPVGKWLPFEESFPQMVEFLRQGNAHLPAWLDKRQIPACPWTSRADFKKNFNSPEMKELRQFLLDTVAEQTQFLVARAQGAMNKILKNTPDGADREHIITQFSRITRASTDLYPLIDYINFKGEGTNPAETAIDKQTGSPQGWGLKQVLLKMNGTTGEPKAVLAEFTDAVQQVLQQRVRNLPSNRIWEAGWLRRAETYRRPISDLEPSPKRAQNVSLRASAR
jgi:hypothetical protein